MSDMSTFIPEPQILQVGGKAIEVAELKMGPAIKFGRAMRDAGERIVDGDFYGAIYDTYESMRAGVAIATGVDPDWIDELDQAAFARLALAVIHANPAFLKALAQAKARAKAQATTVTEAGGEQPSRPSDA